MQKFSNTQNHEQKEYIAPQMEQIECKVEQGFAGSTTQTGNEAFQDGQSYDESNFIFF